MKHYLKIPNLGLKIPNLKGLRERRIHQRILIMHRTRSSRSARKTSPLTENIDVSTSETYQIEANCDTARTTVFLLLITSILCIP